MNAVSYIAQVFERMLSVQGSGIRDQW